MGGLWARAPPHSLTPPAPTGLNNSSTRRANATAAAAARDRDAALDERDEAHRERDAVQETFVAGVEQAREAGVVEGHEAATARANEERAALEVDLAARADAERAALESRLEHERAKRKAAEELRRSSDAKRRSSDAKAAKAEASAGRLWQRQALAEQGQALAEQRVEALQRRVDALEESLRLAERERERQRKAATTRAARRKNDARTRRRAVRHLAGLRGELDAAQAQSTTDNGMISLRKSAALKSHTTVAGADALLHFRDVSSLSGAKLGDAVKGMDVFRSDGGSFEMRPPSRTSIYRWDQKRFYCYMAEQNREILDLIATGCVGVAASADLTSILGLELATSAFMLMFSLVGDAFDIDGQPSYSTSLVKYENPLLALAGKGARDLADAMLALFKLRGLLPDDATVETCATKLHEAVVSWTSDQGSENAGGWRNVRFKEGDGGMFLMLFVGARDRLLGRLGRSRGRRRR